MKKIFIYLIILFAFTACEDVIDLDLPTEAPRLVIDAAIERINTLEEDGSLSIKDSLFVQLSLTRSFFSETPQFVEDAEVNITAINLNDNIDLEHIGNGIYTFDNRPLGIQIDPTESYQLKVNYKGETYEATEEFQTATPLINVQQIPLPQGIGNEGFFTNISFLDKPGNSNFLVFNFGKGDITVIDDELIEEGTIFSFQNFFDEDEVKSINSIGEEEFSLTTKIIGSDKRFANYADDLSTISDNGGPFGVTPFKVRGNIVNTTNTDNFAFGYFRASEIFQQSISLEKSSEFNNQ